MFAAVGDQGGLIQAGIALDDKDLDHLAGRLARNADGGDLDAASDYLSSLQREGRYARDVY